MADLLSVAEAQSIVAQTVRPLAAVTMPLTPAVLGCVLAEDIFSDLDSPPFDKALMDGYAVRADDLATGQAELRVIEEVTAGRTPSMPVGPGQTTRIMTGAPIPIGADAVIPVERTRLDGSKVHITDRTPSAGANVMARAQEMRRGEKIMSSGDVLRPVELGLLAGVGRTDAKVIRRPCVAILSTGDEIVEAPKMPGPGQIRNTNGPMLTALVSSSSSEALYFGNARDRLDSLTPLVNEGLSHDALVLCGGVSAGKLDLVPGVLRDAGVKAHFHKVAMKPGKPVFFGTRGQALVFGLPGNPASSLACFELFVRPALGRLRGLADPGPHFVPVPLAEAFSHKTDRPTYHPARLDSTATGWTARRVPWAGSADLRGLTRANALMLLPAGEHVYNVGQSVQMLMLK